MTIIRLYAHPFSDEPPEIFEADSIAAWLIEHYGETPAVRVQVFAGEPCAESEITEDVERIIANDSPEYVVLQSPGWEGIVVKLVIMVVMMVVAQMLAPKPTLPSNVNRTQQSPNNALSSRQNQVRVMERVEDIFGTVKSVPSLMMPTYNKYLSHEKYEYGYYCVGRGYYDLAEIRDGDTLISEVDGASASVYAPFTSPNSGHSPQVQIGDAIIDNVLTVSRSVEIDGVTLKAQNQVQLAASGKYSYTQSGGNGIIAQKEGSPAMGAVCEADTSVTVVMDDFPVMIDPGDPEAIPPVDPTYATYNYSGTYTVIAVDDRSITVSDVAWPETIPWETVETTPPVGETQAVEIITPIYSSVQIDGLPEYTDWITLPDADRTEVWCNILAQNGMYKDGGDGKIGTAVAFSLEIEKLNAALEPLGVVETVSGSISGKVTDERADTIEHATAWVGPARVRMRRTTPYDYDFEGTVQDEIKWGDLYSVSPVTKSEFGNKTTIHTITKATARATAVKTRELNCIASRKIPTYNGSAFSGAFDANGRHVSGTIHATSKLCDIIAAVSVDPKIGARDIATEVDMAQIYGVQQQLDAWNPECGQFNYTFDTDNFSFEETVVAIANAGFCVAYRQNGKIRLALDRAQPASTALFTHRNKKPNAETITRIFASDADYDGVEFIYSDPETEQSETIILPLDHSYTKLKKFEIPGIISYEQAWLRASREYAKLLGQRVNIETTTTLDARSLLPNARIDIVDNTRFKSYDGEVVGQEGLTLTLSRDVAFSPGLPHSIVLMQRDGSLQSLPATPGSAPNKIILGGLPIEPLVTDFGSDGIRTIFSFAADSARGSMAYLVQEIDITDGQYVTVKAINYSPDYFAADYEPIPGKFSVIN